jgi:hypothetical protein
MSPPLQKVDFAAKKTLSHKADGCNLLDMLQTIKDCRPFGIVDSDSGRRHEGNTKLITHEG